MYYVKEGGKDNIMLFSEEDNNTEINTDDDNKEDGECKRGYFNWEGKCNQCPPGQSTVNTGASYEDCIGTYSFRSCNSL